MYIVNLLVTCPIIELTAACSQLVAFALVRRQCGGFLRVPEEKSEKLNFKSFIILKRGDNEKKCIYILMLF
jgi:hypothetical protein